jgi:hypothetical protein
VMCCDGDVHVFEATSKMKLRILRRDEIRGRRRSSLRRKAERFAVSVQCRGSVRWSEWVRKGVERRMRIPLGFLRSVGVVELSRSVSRYRGDRVWRSERMDWTFAHDCAPQ